MSQASALLSGTHPLRADEDIPLEKLMAARTPAALAWGQLQGRLAYAPPAVASMFAYRLVRASLTDALQKSGFASAEIALSYWFCGLDALPADTPQTEMSASQVADGLLVELSLSTWEPLAEAASVVRRAARYDRADALKRDRSSQSALAQAKRIASRANILIGKKWPLAVLDHIHGAASESPDFVTFERGKIMVSGPAGLTTVEQAPSKPPIWALDVFAGQAIAAHLSGTVPLPCPGAYRAEALRPELWANERGLLVANAVQSATITLIRHLDEAYVAQRRISNALCHCRRTSRAASLAILLAGFGPLRPVQIESALRFSKNGVLGVDRKLIAADLASNVKSRGRTLLQYVS